ncbi:MAG: FkbM family methyltransferase [Hyphomonadaceae bacterium]
MLGWLNIRRKTAASPLFGMEPALEGLRQRGVRPAVVFDIGASDGGWSALALRTWPAARVHCFEPLKVRAQALADFAARNPGRVTHHPVGVSDADGELQLGVTEDLWASSFAYKGQSAQTAQVRSLDSMLSEGVIEKPDFVKIDVQGFERRVISGGTSALASCSFILMECTFYPFCAEMRPLDETIAFVAEAGFVPYEFVDFLRRPIDGAMGQCDMLFIRRSHELMKDTRWA